MYSLRSLDFFILFLALFLLYIASAHFSFQNGNGLCLFLLLFVCFFRAILEFPRAVMASVMFLKVLLMSYSMRSSVMDCLLCVLNWFQFALFIFHGLILSSSSRATSSFTFVIVTRWSEPREVFPT